MNASDQQARRRLAAARVVGAGVSGLLGMLAVEMPMGYFGASDAITPFGQGFAAILSVLATVAAATLWLGWRSGAFLSASVFALNIGLFLPALPADPLVSSVVIAWNMILLTSLLFPTRRRLPDASRNRPSDPGGAPQWLATNGAAARHLVMVAVLATIGVAGYDLGRTAAVHLVNLGADIAVLAVLAPFLVARARSGSRLAYLALALGVAAVAGITVPLAALAALTASLLVTLLLLAAQLPLVRDLADLFFERPAILVLSSFVVLIAFGAVLLSFPAAAAPGRPVSPTDALFTATSAACVTGLIVLDTPHDFSLFGQAVILALIQVGGLNIMVLSTFAAILLGRGLGIRGERALGEVLDLQASRSAYRLIASIVGITLAVEALGAAVLTAAWLPHADSFVEAAWLGLFHAVSAFCNAGFALFSDSMMGFQEQPIVLLTVAFLITLGGLGFAVMASAWLRLSGTHRIGLAVQLRVVLVGSAILVAIAWIAVLIAEWSSGLAHLGLTDKLSNGLLQSVTLRTAGFNSIALDTLNPALLLIFIAMMFIGASPGGTGGGIKTTTVAVLLSAIPAVVRGRAEVVLLKRRIGLDTVFRSTVIAVVAMLCVLVGAVALLATQRGDMTELVFEAFSAFGTVGLSLGATAKLDGLGKAIVMALMLTGRIGPLTLALALGRRHSSRIGYPETKIMVG